MSVGEEQYSNIPYNVKVHVHITTYSYYSHQLVHILVQIKCIYMHYCMTLCHPLSSNALLIDKCVNNMAGGVNDKEMYTVIVIVLTKKMEFISTNRLVGKGSSTEHHMLV